MQQTPGIFTAAITALLIVLLLGFSIASEAGASSALLRTTPDETALPLEEAEQVHRSFDFAPPTQGSLQIVGAGESVRSLCPLKHTKVKARVDGFLARVDVTQVFINPASGKVEAVYTFPLPQNAAVDRMTMFVGERIVRGVIMRREEAHETYQTAKIEGRIAGLLDQQRPNIFTQYVANIPPGALVTVRIGYVETLTYEDGAYEFVFPMVVGARYSPVSKDASILNDARNVTPPLAGVRAGHDISLEMTIDAGVPVTEVQSLLHDVDISRMDERRLDVRLAARKEIPNRDFIFRYRTAGAHIEDALLTYRKDQGDGFFAFILQPPQSIPAEDVTPKELVFVLDTSGSMQGFPIEKAKETMSLALAALNPQDTFNLITFAGDTRITFPYPVSATPENLRQAQAVLADTSGAGGTEMMTAVRAALEPSDAQDHLRVVCFMTDGYVENDREIIGEIMRHPNARVFSFGIGDSVNRFLLDKMAEVGRGAVEYVTLAEEGSAAARRFHERVRNPLLTDISVDWKDLSVADVSPRRLPDLFGSTPVVLTGRYKTGGRGRIRLQGKLAGRPFVREIQVILPDERPDGEVLATLWARRQIEALMLDEYGQTASDDYENKRQEAVTQLGLKFGLMTDYTSFVAVEESRGENNETPRRINVPIEMPHGNGLFAGASGYISGSDLSSEFDMVTMTRNVGVGTKVTMLTLLGMLLTLIVVTLKQVVIYIHSRNASRNLDTKHDPSLPFRNLADVADLGAEHSASHSTCVIQPASLNAHPHLSSAFPSHDATAVSRLAQARLIKSKHVGFRRGITIIRSIAATAVLVGVCGTIIGVINTLEGARAAESAGIGALAGGISEALLISAFGLMISIAATWISAYFDSRHEAMNAEVNGATSNFVNRLTQTR